MNKQENVSEYRGTRDDRTGMGSVPILQAAVVMSIVLTVFVLFSG